MFKFIKGFFRLLIILILLVVLLFTYARFLEPRILKDHPVSILSPRVSENSDGLKIALFADTHFGAFYTVSDFEKVIESINSNHPDLVIFAGDLIDKFDDYEGNVADISASLNRIQSKYGKFAVFGNHDYGGGAEREYSAIMENGGFTVLKNQYFALDELGISIIGIDDMLIGYGSTDIVSWARTDYFNIAISHAPDVLDEVLDANIDLMLSGHTHGRQVNLPPFDDYILPPGGKKYVKGIFDFENHRNTQLYVTPGLGTTQMPLRFLSPPEITFLTLRTGN
ncbi:MAG: metallophosphoesterase [Anaerovorax sp.]